MSTFDTSSASSSGAPSTEGSADASAIEWTRADVRILIANHDSFGRAYLCRIVSRLGVPRAAWAADGCEVLSKLVEEKFQILLLDLELPDISGLEILEILRTDPAYEHLEVLVTTGMNREAVVRRAIALGISDYLIKPFRQQLLEERFERVLNRIRERAAAAGQKGRLGSTLLLVDDDQNFVDTIQSVFGTRHNVLVARTQAEVLTATLRNEPSCILIDPTVLGERLEFLVNTVRRISKNDSLKIVFLLAKGATDSEVYHDASLAKSYVPDTLRSTLSPYLSQPNVVVWLTGLERDLATATEQTFGMMAGAELRTLDTAADTVSEMVMTISLTEQPLGQEWLLAIECSNELDSSLTAALLGVDPGDAETDQVSGIDDVLNVLAGRVKQCAHDVGTALELGLPHRVASIGGQGQSLDRRLSIVFQWADIKPFRVSLLGTDPSGD